MLSSHVDDAGSCYGDQTKDFVVTHTHSDLEKFICNAQYKQKTLNQTR